MRRVLALFAVLLLGLSGCQTTASELGGLAADPPLDYAVMVTGGAFLSSDAVNVGTFFDENAAPGAPGSNGSEPIRIEEVASILERGRVFRRVSVDANPARRRAITEQLAANGASDAKDAEAAEDTQQTDAAATRRPLPMAPETVPSLVARSPLEKQPWSK